MPTKKKTEKDAAPEGVLEQAAKKIGSALGSIAAKTGIAHAEPKKSGRLVKKGKKRLPRREKKKAQKVAAKANPA